MLLDDLAQYWGHAQGLPGLRIGMTADEASAAIPAHVQRSAHGGELHFTVGDPLQQEGPAALRCAIKRWREIRIDATKQWDHDESFWSGASLVTEYLADELGAPRPRVKIGRRGQEQLRLRCQGIADGAPVEAQLFAEGQTEEGLTMELSLLPVRRWSDLVGDALGVGPALSSLVFDPAAGTLPRGSTLSLPTDLDGSHIEVLRAEDGALRARVSTGSVYSTGAPLAGMASTDAGDLLRRQCARHEDLDGLGFQCVVYRGLQGPEGPLEVRLSRRPTAKIEAELIIRAPPPA